MTNLIKLAELFDFQHAESAAPLLRAIFSCRSIEELQALLAYMGNNEGFDAIAELVRDRIIELERDNEPEHKKQPETQRPPNAPRRLDDDGPSPY